MKRVAIGLPRLLKRVHRLAVQRRVRFTLKARQPAPLLAITLAMGGRADVFVKASLVKSRLDKLKKVNLTSAPGAGVRVHDLEDLLG